ncbi:alpha-hydroxy-acid oxidizing protein [Deinococcus ruber]|uniref:Oxidoreductase n=1 Tax=Deinococcus ruber TaxID=1848197 RepID=A0A918BY55_9DEIO|nr:alpha-hydroxy-acid oxidizing protein [Deinococcus ruber]GGQ96676.1 oxidoreductase [Deinococcus ruber]
MTQEATQAGGVPSGERSVGRVRQTGIYVAGLGGELPKVPVDAGALERAAEAVLPPSDFAYLAGGAGQGRTMQANTDAFARWPIVPRMMRGSARRDLSTELLGHTYASPLLLAPIGVLECAHPEADLAVARAAAAEGVPYIFSSQASVDMETCAAAMGEAARWFQLYWSSDDELTRSFVRRAEDVGAQAIVLTLDTTLLGWRPRDLDFSSLPFMRGRGLAQYLSDPVFRSRLSSANTPALNPPRTPALLTAMAELGAKGAEVGLPLEAMLAAVARFSATFSRPDLSWDDLSRLREWTRLPIVLKGILHPDDAREAAARGMDALIVSNHGGRQIDGSVGALDALPAVVAAAGGLPVLFDSGIRGGADVFRALALGARAVLLGRPYAYGLALAGEAGVREVIQNVLAELDLTLGLAGVPRARDVDRQAVTRN